VNAAAEISSAVFVKQNFLSGDWRCMKSTDVQQAHNQTDWTAIA
jgi:hypothetical protein